MRRRLPPAAKAPVRRLKWAYRRLTSDARAEPSLLVLGAQKAGTSSLAFYLGQHPAIVPPRAKEVHFFDRDYDRGPAWYRSHFPRRAELERATRRGDGQAITLDASPSYLPHPRVPERVRELLPHAHFVVMLRDPVERAISHYHHARGHGREHRPLEEAMEAELAAGDATLSPSARFENPPIPELGYLQRGYYADQLERWFSRLPREQFLIVQSEAFFADPRATHSRVCEFVGLPFQPLDGYRVVGGGAYSTPHPSTVAQLRDHYRAHNERLWELLGEEFDW